MPVYPHDRRIRWTPGMPFVPAETSGAIGRTHCQTMICSVSLRRGGDRRRHRTAALGFRACHRSGSVAGTVHCVAGRAISRRLRRLLHWLHRYRPMSGEARSIRPGPGHDGHDDRGHRPRHRHRPFCSRRTRRGPRDPGCPDDHIVAYLLRLGYPADRPLTPISKPDRRPFDEVVRRGTGESRGACSETVSWRAV